MSRAVPRFKRRNALLPLFAPLTAYRVTMVYVCDGQIALWNMDYLMNNSAQTSASEANIATSFNGNQGANIKAVLAADCFLNFIKVQCLNLPSRLPGFVTFAAGAAPGTVAGNHIPLEMAAIISKATFTKGQHGRGRLYLPGIPSSFVAPGTDANRLTPGGVTAVTTLASSLITLPVVDGAGNGFPAVTQRVGQGFAITNGQSIAQLLVRTLLGTVRRRRLGRGK